jgi:HEAT repeat protein
MNRRWVGILVIACGCGPPTPPHEGKSVGQLRAMLDDTSPTVQAQGALGLSLHGEAAREAVPRLTALLDSPDALVRRQAALALGAVGPEARPAVPALVKLLRHDDWATRRQAAVALGAIGDRSVKGALEQRKDDRNGLVRRAVLDALTSLAREPKR